MRGTHQPFGVLEVRVTCHVPLGTAGGEWHVSCLYGKLMSLVVRGASTAYSRGLLFECEGRMVACATDSTLIGSDSAGTQCESFWKSAAIASMRNLWE